MRSKKCSLCKEDIPIGNFYKDVFKPDKLNSSCKECIKKYVREYREANKDKVAKWAVTSYKGYTKERKAYAKKYKNSKKGKDTCKNWRKKNRDKLNKRERERKAKNRPPKIEYLKGMHGCMKCKGIKPIEAFPKDVSKKKGYSNVCKPCVNASKRAPEFKAKKRARHKYRVQHDETYRRYYKAKQKAGTAVRRARKRNHPYNWKALDEKICIDYFKGMCVYCKTEPSTDMDHYIPLFNDYCPGTVPRNMVPACSKCNGSKSAKCPEDWVSIEVQEEIEEYFKSL